MSFISSFDFPVPGQGSEVQGKSLLEQVREKGFVSFVEELQEAALHARARQKVLAGLNLSEESLDELLKKLSPEGSAKLMARIEDLIKKRIEEDIAEMAEEKVEKVGDSIS